MLTKLVAAATAGGVAIFLGTSAMAAQQLSQAECNNIWNQANPSNSAMISQPQAQDYVTNFQKVDANSDGQLSQDEFQKGCNEGLVQSSAASGSSSGASGSNENPMGK